MTLGSLKVTQGERNGSSAIPEIPGRPISRPRRPGFPPPAAAPAGPARDAGGTGRTGGAGRRPSSTHEFPGARDRRRPGPAAGGRTCGGRPEAVRGRTGGRHPAPGRRPDGRGQNTGARGGRAAGPGKSAELPAVITGRFSAAATGKAGRGRGPVFGPRHSAGKPRRFRPGPGPAGPRGGASHSGTPRTRARGAGTGAAGTGSTAGPEPALDMTAQICGPGPPAPPPRRQGVPIGPISSRGWSSPTRPSQALITACATAL